MRRDGKWFETFPEPNTIMMNIGDLMHRWTVDKYVSTVSVKICSLARVILDGTWSFSSLVEFCGSPPPVQLNANAISTQSPSRLLKWKKGNCNEKQVFRQEKAKQFSSWSRPHFRRGSLRKHWGCLVSSSHSLIFALWYMQRHRVRVSEDEARSRRVRRSLVFFTSPDLGATISCVDGSRKYPDFDGNEYIWSRAAEVRSHKSES